MLIGPRFYVWKSKHSMPWIFYDRKYCLTYYYYTWKQAMARMDITLKSEKEWK